MDKDGRPDPDALLALLQGEQPGTRGRLKIFLGSAPGVGKTWAMLDQARRRQADGTDVVAGVIETHGRAETAAQLVGLTVLEPMRVPYRGLVLDEFDLPGALARRPALLLVDELAHTNAPGGRHAKRWEDVASLIEAGIAVWATLNVQHLESLNDDVARITGIRPAETLPDRALEMADEIELVDVPPAELRQRLRDGKIYRPANAARALDGFFKEGNLAALREIALRRAAAHVDEDVQHWMRRSGIAGPWPTAERVVALIGPDAAAEAVVRQAKRLAAALHAPWVALHIEQPGAVDGSAVRAPIALAAQLGGELDLRASGGADLVGAVLAAARARNATHLVIGRSPEAGWRRLLGRTLSTQLIRRGPDFVMHVVPAPDVTRPRAAPPVAGGGGAGWWPWVGTALLVAAVTAVGLVGVWAGVLPRESADLAYLAAIVVAATVWSTRPAMAAALAGLLCWDFFFVDPVGTLTIGNGRDLLTGAVFAAIAALTGSLAGRVRTEVTAAAARIEGLRRIGAFSRALGEPATEDELLGEVARQAAALAPSGAVLVGEDLGRTVVEPRGGRLDERALAAAQWAWSRGEAAGRGTTTLPGAAWRFLPLQTVRGRLGVLGIRPPDGALSEPSLQAVEALADQAALALERVRLAGRAARAAAAEETQRLRTALLASLGHDLRTPLTAIQGAAETLRGAWDSLDEAVRADLLLSIEEEVGRMTRLLVNITDLTRLEGGDVRPNRSSLVLRDVVEAAVERVSNALFVAVHVPDGLAVLADAGLLEQALSNVLDNARKYAPDGTFVRVRAEAAAGGMVSVSVSDEGVGIPPEDLSQVFDGFFRVDRADRTVAGLGLGLAIARGFVVAMGGTIVARSPNPSAASGGLPGTVVTMLLPARVELEEGG